MSASRDNLLSRITVEPGKCGGRPCVRGLRVRVQDVLELLGGGMSPTQVIEELPYLEPEDVQACLVYAARRLDYPSTAA